MTEPNEPSPQQPASKMVDSKELESALKLANNLPPLLEPKEKQDSMPLWSAEVNESPNEPDGHGETVSVDHPESDEKPFSGILARAAARAEFGEVTGQKATKKEIANKQEADEEALSVIVATVVVIAVAYAFGDDVKPSEEQAQAFADPVASILSRRLSLPSGMSDDVLDLIAAGGVVLLWWKEAAPILKARRDSPPPSSPPPSRQGPKGNGRMKSAAQEFMQ
jgi:hypothetical protein